MNKYAGVAFFRDAGEAGVRLPFGKTRIVQFCAYLHFMWLRWLAGCLSDGRSRVDFAVACVSHARIPLHHLNPQDNDRRKAESRGASVGSWLASGKPPTEINPGAPRSAPLPVPADVDPLEPRAPVPGLRTH